MLGNLPMVRGRDVLCGLLTSSRREMINYLAPSPPSLSPACFIPFIIGNKFLGPENSQYTARYAAPNPKNGSLAMDIC